MGTRFVGSPDHHFHCGSRVANQRGGPLKVNLAISLNATTDELRHQIMPAATGSIAQALLAACRDYPLAERDRLTFEYVLLADVERSA